MQLAARQLHPSPHLRCSRRPHTSSATPSRRRCASRSPSTNRGISPICVPTTVNLSSQALGAIARQIEKHPGKEYHQPRRFQTKSKGAQEAHEAIRPTYIDRERVGGTAQEQRLYDLIRKRTLASQMADAEIERTTVSIPVAGTDYAFTAQAK